ncbi:MAG: F0F1 ATP synthase subunit B [Bacteroidaceae bacterium]
MLIAFLVVFCLLAKFGFPVIIKMVEERKAFIDESLKSARAANEKLANIKTESESILQKAREQQALILKEAMLTRDNIVKEAKNKANLEGNRLLSDAKAQIDAEKENALRDIRAQVAILSLNIAEKVVRKNFEDQSNQMELIDRLLNEASVSKN